MKLLPGQPKRKEWYIRLAQFYFSYFALTIVAWISEVCWIIITEYSFCFIFMTWLSGFMISAAIENIQITYASIELKFNQTATQTTKAEEMIYPIGTVLFQLFRSYYSRMNKCSLWDNQYEIPILFHFHDVKIKNWNEAEWIFVTWAQRQNKPLSFSRPTDSK